MPLKCTRLNDLKWALWIVRANYKAVVQTLYKPQTYKIAIYKDNRRKGMGKTRQIYNRERNYLKCIIHFVLIV
jgi:hypothetical protein